VFLARGILVSLFILEYKQNVSLAVKPQLVYDGCPASRGELVARVHICPASRGETLYDGCPASRRSAATAPLLRGRIYVSATQFYFT